MDRAITVIIPTYNKSDYISQTIESVMQQTYQNFEIVIIDDCSQDNTEVVVKKYLSDHIRYFRHQRNWGPGATFNDGIERADTEYVTLVASDDILLPNHLDLVMNEFKKNRSIETVFSRIKTIDEHGKDLRHIVEPQANDRYQLLKYLFYVGNAMPSPGISFKKTLFQKTPLFNPALIQLHDYDLNVRSLIFGEMSIVTEPTVLYRRFSSCTVNLSGNMRWIDTCHRYETGIVLDNFLYLKPKYLRKIFPQLETYTDDEIVFRLLIDTCKNRQDRLRAWAFERLIKYIESNDKLFKNNTFDFQYKDYINLYRLNSRNIIGTTHKARLYYNIARIMRRLFGLK